jgi:peptidoglycan/LPS O-acetylase OafA/YrhL
MIVNHHTRSLEIPYLWQFTKGGFIFNTVFVYLSGYLLGKSYSQKRTSGFNQFMFKRINRIYPGLHIALIFIAIIYYYLGKTITYRDAILSATGFQYFFGITTFGPQFWFISVILLCYLLCIPSISILKKYPLIFFVFLITFVTIIIMSRGDSLNLINKKINNDFIYRFLYHYIIFVIALFASIRGKDLEVFSCLTAYIIALTLFPLYLFLHSNYYFDYIYVPVAVLLALSSITLISSSYPLIAKIFPSVFFLSSITYEIYLIHFSVITIFEYTSPGKFYAYPAVFLGSIALAFMVSKFAGYYRRLLSKFYTYTFGSPKPILKS